MGHMKEGDKVRVKEHKAAYYSGYGNSPIMIISHDMVGEIKHTNVPCVRGKEGATFIVADFAQPTGKVFRGAFNKKELVKIIK